MSSKPPIRRQSSAEQMLLIGVSVLLGATFLLWLTGEVGGFLHSGGTWPRVSIGEMGGVMVRVFRSPADPTAAWPADVRNLLPGPVSFYVILAILLLLCTAAYMYLAQALRAMRRRLSSTVVVQHSSAPAGGPTGPGGWARPHLFRELFVRGAQPGRVVLGRISGRLVAAERLQSVIAIGPAQSQKTSGLTVPAVLEWDGPVLAACMKADLIRHTMSQRWHKGEVHLYDPAGVTGLDASTWSPLSRCVTWEGAYRMARSLVDAGRGVAQGTPDADFLHNAAATLLAALLLAAATSDRSMGDVVRWVQRHERAEVSAALSVAGEPAANDALQLISSLTDQHRSQVYAAVLTVIGGYSDPAVREGVLTTQLSAERLLDGRANTAYVCAPAHEQRRLGPLFVALVQDMIDLAYERSSQLGRPLDPPLLVVLDDAATSAALPQLDVYAAGAASRGVQLVTTFRHVSQMQARYGERAEVLLNNHRAKIVLSGITDQVTLGVLSHLLEDDTVRTLAAPNATPVKEGDSLRTRYPSPAEALRRISPGQGVLLYGHLPPAHLTLRPWFRDRRLLSMVSDEGASLAEPLA
ncbi:MAG TPA: type IV secretory system conjugative DNA transfer family protein [Actinomycetes bacterium]|nr:type IV secretory system conjugative DNA transfer family protein [Actinomycetes bacterium]